MKKAQEWESRRQTTEVFARAPVVDCYRVRKPPAFDGKLGDDRFPDELRERVPTPGDPFDETHRCPRSLVKVGGDVDLADRGRITRA